MNTKRPKLDFIVMFAVFDDKSVRQVIVTKENEQIIRSVLSKNGPMRVLEDPIEGLEILLTDKT